jgi:CspA family cold shock protein
MAQRSTGVVKWFNNKAGYGFLTVMGDGQTPEDIFVHHSEIQVEKDQYKYLVQGEYVEFVLSTDAGEHKCLASAVRGVNGGKLMCETRSDRPQREYTPREHTHNREHTPRDHNRSQPSSFRGHHTTPLRQTEDDQVEWLLVKRRTTTQGRGGGRGGRRPVAELS